MSRLRDGRTFIVFMTLGLIVILFSTLAAGCGNGDTASNGDQTQDGDNGKVALLTWPTIYRDARHTGRSASSGPSSADIKWTCDAGSDTWSWAVLGRDGDVICGFMGKVASVDAESGGIKWEFSTGGERATSCCIAGDGTVYTSAGSNIYALTPEGSQKWSYDVGGEADEPAVDLDGTVYAGSVGGRLVALSGDGALKWDAQVSGDIRTPTISRDALYCGASPLVLYAFDKEGVALWEARPEGDLPVYEGMTEWANTLDYASIGDDGTIYVGSFPYPGITATGQMIADYAIPTMGRLYAISPQGQLRWKYECPYQDCTYFNIHTPSIGRDGTLYAGTSHWRVLAIDPDGNLIWEFNTGEGQSVCPSVFSPSIAKDGLLYAATTSGKMFCLNPDGTEKWRYDSGTPWLADKSRSNNLTPPPLGEDGTLFTVQADGKVYAFKAAGE
ncbi:MAG: PQQ-like beta-propeller repeat protein [Actinobacteria bacterium]|nr:PQQ-like beta-propeller repeat protein [Actinomycetota bacterium]